MWLLLLLPLLLLLLVLALLVVVQWAQAVAIISCLIWWEMLTKQLSRQPPDFNQLWCQL
jgi:hypothetical protein